MGKIIHLCRAPFCVCKDIKIMTLIPLVSFLMAIKDFLIFVDLSSNGKVIKTYDLL